MKSKCLVWFLAICLLSVTTVLGRDQRAKPANIQTPGNLAQDVILVPVDAPALADEFLQLAGPLNINAAFNANLTPQQRAVFQQAITEWTAIIRTSGVTPGNYPIMFSNGPLTGTNLAVTTTTFNSSNGNLISANIVFDNRPATTWYVDPNPANDVEFNGTPPAGFDLLSVARHELGHALGWANTNRVTALLSGNVFDLTRLNIGTVSTGGLHANSGIHAFDIMIPSIPASTRRSVSLYPAVALVARAFFYDIAMSFVDSTYTGTETGSANTPWNTVREGADLASFGQLLLTPGTYNDAVPLTLARPLTIKVARGADAVIGKRP
jgi:hypothetical protein